MDRRFGRIPAPGDQVLYRHDQGGPVEPAQVTWVEFPGDRNDPRVWDEFGNLLLEPDPEVFLRTKASPGQERHTRQARLAGSPGWLWPDAAGGAPRKPELKKPLNCIEALPGERAAIAAGTAQPCNYTCVCHGDHVCLRAKHRDEDGHRTEHVAEIHVTRDGEIVKEWVTWSGPCRPAAKGGKR